VAVARAGSTRVHQHPHLAVVDPVVITLGVDAAAHVVGRVPARRHSACRQVAGDRVHVGVGAVGVWCVGASAGASSASPTDRGKGQYCRCHHGPRIRRGSHPVVHGFLSSFVSGLMLLPDCLADSFSFARQFCLAEWRFVFGRACQV
jgi:hypothetical protein